VAMDCLRNSLPTDRLKQDGTCTKYYFQSLLTTESITILCTHLSSLCEFVIFSVKRVTYAA
jgi:hypothetical protein